MQKAPPWERLLYLLVICYLHCKVLLHGYAFSQNVSQRIHLPGLKSGWLFGLKVDLSDVQWRDFRGSLPMLAVFYATFLLLSHVVQRLSQDSKHRTVFYATVATLFIGDTLSARHCE